jgi:distribution and morphology protein 34
MRSSSPKKKDREFSDVPPAYTPPADDRDATLRKKEKPKRPTLRTIATEDFAHHHAPSSSELLRTLSSERLAFGSSASNFGSLNAPFSPHSEASSGVGNGGILEQAWLNKIAKDITRKVEEERRKQQELRERGEENSIKRREGGLGMSDIGAPPAYAV